MSGMKRPLKYLFNIVFYLFSMISVYAQRSIINGKISDGSTNKPIAFAHVFLANTNIGTTSNVNGEFILRNIPLGEFTIVVSMVGYHMFSSIILIKSGEIPNPNIQLVPFVHELEEVLIEEEPDRKWKRLYKVFEREFLGESENAKLCEIKNPWVIEFSEESSKYRLVATAYGPIEILNKSLGYKVFYYLNGFFYDNGNLRYTGFPRFEYMDPSDKQENLDWISNRNRTFTGSLRHFFYEFINKTYPQEGFRVYRLIDGESKILAVEDVDDILISNEVNNSYSLMINDPLEVHYLNKSYFYIQSDKVYHPVSEIRPLRSSINCSKTGWVNDGMSFQVFGYWAKERAADMLPFDYVNNSDSSDEIQNTSEN